MNIHETTLNPSTMVYFGEETTDLLIEEVGKLKPDRVLIVTDRTVEALYSEFILEKLPYDTDAELIVFNEGEENKNISTLQHVATDLLRAHATDRSLVLGLGGGGALNMAGLAASLLHHGLRFAQVATTVTAQGQVIASNHQAMNFAGQPNAMGVYRTPLFAIADPVFLESEPEEQVCASLVDFAKHALILGGENYDLARDTLLRAKHYEQPALAETVEAFFHQTSRIGRLDPGELDVMALRRYGSAAGRSLESLSEGKLLAGQARYFGLRIAAELSAMLGFMSSEEYDRHQALLGLLRIEAKIPGHVKPERLLHKLHGNNKTSSDDLEFMLLESVGRVAGAGGSWRGASVVPDSVILDAIEKVFADAVL